MRVETRQAAFYCLERRKKTRGRSALRDSLKSLVRSLHSRVVLGLQLALCRDSLAIGDLPALVPGPNCLVGGKPGSSAPAVVNYSRASGASAEQKFVIHHIVPRDVYPAPFPLRVPLCSTCRTCHQARIVSTGSMVVVLDALRTNLRRQLEASRDVVGRNMAGLRILGRLADQDSNSYLMESEEDRLAKKMRQA